MTAILLDGKLLAQQIKSTIKERVSHHTSQGFTAPGLAVVLLGNNPSSAIYVTHKRRACEEVGFRSFAYDLSIDTPEEKLLELIRELNNREDIHGILVQLPLPDQVTTSKIIESIKPSKDVDGFHPYNLGRLAQGHPLLRPCTPYGIIQLLEHYHLPLQGRHAVVVGASNIVGRPMALEFLMAKSTVTICHKATVDLKQHVEFADIIVVATGSYDVVKADWLSQKQILVDVGMHRRDDQTLHGDVLFEVAQHCVSYITPVPGGVGPMTIATLLTNTLKAAGL